MTDDSAAAFADGLWAERVGPRRYTGHNTRGALVQMGPAEAGAVFTPGELLKVALAGCNGMSADHSLARKLGQDVAVAVHVAGPTDPQENRYRTLHEQLVVDLSGLDETERARLVTVVGRAIDRQCTVGRTLEHATDMRLQVIDRRPT
jgi:uncharacterized OsmC-like protein